jgi:hypothetical protein
MLRERFSVLGIGAIALLFSLLTLGTCAAANLSPQSEELHMWMTVGEHRFATTLTDNAAARELARQLPLTLNVSELNGNEKHGRLPEALPQAATKPGTIRSGDIMLYGADTLVVFYSTFESSYSYTRIGRVDDPARLAEALGKGAAKIVFSKKWPTPA